VKNEEKLWMMLRIWTDWHLIREVLGTSDLKEGADVAVGEDHRGGTVSQESDVTSTALGRKGTVKHR
jgi:hypothetical protein